MFEGMEIRTFADTDVDSYLQMIRDQGYEVTCKGRIIKVGKMQREIKEQKMKEFSRKLRTARKGKKLDRKQLAELLGVSSSTIYDWEIGRRIPNAYNMDRIKKFFGGDLWQ